MTDERFEQLMKQALKPEIDERDVVIQKNTNNYKNRMKRKRGDHGDRSGGLLIGYVGLITVPVAYN